MNPEIFEASHISGVLGEDFDEADAWKIGNAAGRFLPSLVRGYERGLAENRRLVVGRDGQARHEPVAQRLIEGIRCTGLDAVDLGYVDPAQLTFAVNHLGSCGGILITTDESREGASRIEVFGMRALPIARDTGLGDIRHLALSLLHTKGNPTGQVTSLDLTEAYREHVLGFLGRLARPLRLMVDAGPGIPPRLLAAVFDGSAVTLVSASGRRPRNPTLSRRIDRLRSALKRDACDLAVCFDDPGERLSVLDECGRRLTADTVGALLVGLFLQDHPGAAVVYDVRCSRVVQDQVIRHGGVPRRERVGRPSMVKAMKDSRAVLGIEHCGRVYFADNFFLDSALLTLAGLARLLALDDAPVSDRVAGLDHHSHVEEFLLPIGNPSQALEQLAQTFSDADVDRLDGLTLEFEDGWLNARPATTGPGLQVILETATAAALRRRRDQVKQCLANLPGPARAD